MSPVTARRAPATLGSLALAWPGGACLPVRRLLFGAEALQDVPQVAHDRVVLGVHLNGVVRCPYVAGRSRIVATCCRCCGASRALHKAFVCLRFGSCLRRLIAALSLEPLDLGGSLGRAHVELRAQRARLGLGAAALLRVLLRRGLRGIQLAEQRRRPLRHDMTDEDGPRAEHAPRARGATPAPARNAASAPARWPSAA